MAIKHGSININHVKEATSFLAQSVYQVNHYNTIVFIGTPTAGNWQNQEISGTTGRVYVSAKGGYVATGTVNAGQLPPWHWQNEYYPYITSLPSEYQEVEYIAATGTQYINTGIALFDVSDHKIVLDIIPTQFYNYNSLWGSTYDADTFEGWIYSSGSFAARYNSKRYGTDNTLTLNTRYLIEVDKVDTVLSKKVNNVSHGTGTATSKITTANFLLFKSGSDYGRFKLYSCKLYKDDKLVRNFIPCYRKSDLVSGLYDLVSNTFFTNSGTGSFTKGNNIVSKTITDIRYVKTGTGALDFHYEIDWEIVTGTRAGEVTGTLNYFTGWDVLT